MSIGKSNAKVYVVHDTVTTPNNCARLGEAR